MADSPKSSGVKAPHEIGKNICGYLTKADMRSMRLTDKRFCVLATPSLFHTIDIYPFKDCFRWCGQLFQNKAIRLEIVNVCYINTYLPACETEGDYVTQVLEHYPALMWTHNSKFCDGLARLKILRQGQLDMITHEEEHRILAWVLKMLPKVSGIQFAAWCSRETLKAEVHMEEEGDSIEKLFDPDHPLRLHKLVRDTYVRPLDSKNPDSVLQDVEGKPEKFASRQTFAETIDTKLGVGKLEYFGIGSLEVAPLLKIFPSNPIPESLARLRELSLYFANPAAPGPPASQLKGLKDMLINTPMLKSLEICFDHHYNSFQETIFLPNILPADKTWPYLESVKLRSIFTPEAPFINFLERHAESLVRLDLSDMRLWNNCTPGAPKSWARVFRVMRNSLQLKEIRLDHVFSNRSINPSEHWIIRTSPCCENLTPYPTCLKGFIEGCIVGICGPFPALPGSKKFKDIRLPGNGEMVRKGGDHCWRYLPKRYRREDQDEPSESDPD